ncbi:MAG: hypothetical protein K8U57_29680 [Planctomycetes bacterium]|nr:hypothetical protein [Planctomycetota bacterium]
MRGMRFAVAGVLALGMVGLAQAQFRPGGGGGGGGPAFLVGNKAVQEDLKLSEDQITKLKEWGKEFQKKAAEIRKDKGVEFSKGGFGKIEPEMREKMDAANAEISKVAYKELADVLKKEQIDRLKQISTQQQGTGAFTNAEVVDALKLTAAQKDSVKGITGDLAKDTKEIFGEPTKGKPDFTKLEENMKKVQKLQKEYMGKLEDILDDSQKKIWKDLKGEAFDTSKLQFQFPKKKD